MNTPTFVSLCALLLLGTAPLLAAQYSKLWGENGELWDPENSRLQNFTDVGYKSGDVSIPDWPVGVNVQDFGAVPNDGIDDSEAFLAAIAACPEKHAVLVPNGRYRIVQQLRIDKDHFVLRGEDMYETVLWFPKNLAELYPAVDYDKSYSSGFFYINGGTHRSIENLTFEFREQIKMGHWEFRGQDAIFYGGDVEDSWVRNIYIKNADHGISMGGAERVSVLNIIFDHFIGRPDVIGSSAKSGWVGHVGIGMGKASKCLFHNIEFKGNYFHDFDIINVPTGSVVSNITSHARADEGFFALHHHGQGARYNLYTNVRGGPIAGLKDSQRQQSETHWNFDAPGGLEADTVPYDTKNNHVFVGYGADLETKVTDTLWFEAIEPSSLHPQNIYLAQMERLGKPLPEEPPPQPPAPAAREVVRLLLEEDAGKGFSRFLKFDLRDLNLKSIAHVRLRFTVEAIRNGPVTLGVSGVTDDTWTPQSIGQTANPTTGPVFNEITLDHQSAKNLAVELDVTSFVQSEYAGDQLVSLYIDKLKPSGFNGFLRGGDGGGKPQLIIEQVPSPVPGAPSPPTRGTTTSKRGHIVLDWEDSPEADVATYNVYRSLNRPGEGQYGMPIATGLDTSDFIDVSIKENRAICEIPSDVTCYYVVTAVDSHGYESAYSAEFTGTALDRKK